MDVKQKYDDYSSFTSFCLSLKSKGVQNLYDSEYNNARELIETMQGYYEDGLNGAKDEYLANASWFEKAAIFLKKDDTEGLKEAKEAYTNEFLEEYPEVAIAVLD